MLIALSRSFLLSRPPGADFSLKSQQDLVKLKKETLAEVWVRPEEIVKACFAKRPNYNDLLPALLEVGVCDELLIRCALSLHVPLRPMLGSITRDLSEMLTKLQGRDFSCEYKYDGQRAQVHCDTDGNVSIFSRHLELMTDKYRKSISQVENSITLVLSAYSLLVVLKRLITCYLTWTGDYLHIIPSLLINPANSS